MPLPPRPSGGAIRDRRWSSRRPAGPCRPAGAFPGPDGSRLRARSRCRADRSAWATSCDTWAARSNAWVWNVTRQLHLGAGLLHHVRQDVLTHGLGDDVIGGIGDRPGARRVFLLLERLHHALEHVAFVRRVAERIGERLGKLRRRRRHRHHRARRRARPAGNATRHSLELNGPMIAITLSSSASLRTPTTA